MDWAQTMLEQITRAEEAARYECKATDEQFEVARRAARVNDQRYEALKEVRQALSRLISECTGEEVPL